MLAPGREITSQEQELVARVLQEVGEEELKVLLEDTIGSHGPTNLLASPDLASHFTLAINRASLEARASREEMLRLALLGGQGLLSLLLKEGSLHKGQGGTVAGLLVLLWPLARAREGGESLLAREVSQLLGPAGEEPETRNTASMCLALVALDPAYCQDLAPALLSLLLQHQQQQQHAAFLATLIAKVGILGRCSASLLCSRC